LSQQRVDVIYKAEAMALQSAKKVGPAYRTTSGDALSRGGDTSTVTHKQTVASVPMSDTKKAVARSASRETTSDREPYSAGTWLFSTLVCALILYAWKARHSGDITPKVGLGYALGIVGSLMMLALLLYPLRKTWKRLSRSGSMQAWFTLHMMFGVLGPALVIVHSNFGLESTNATVAMVVMLLVVASGIFGRYIYSQVHIGMSGKRAEVSELLSDANAMRAAFGDDMQHAPEIETELKLYEETARAYRMSTLGSFRATLFLGFRSRKSHRFVRHEAQAIISARALREHWDRDTHRERLRAALSHFDAYFAAVRHAAGLHFFERLFRFWHVFHMPLFLLLIMVAIGHVVAVHLY
jgi:hypothetical protein